MWTFERGGRKGGVECETKFTKDSTFFKKAYKSSLRMLVASYSSVNCDSPLLSKTKI